ncbi:hypothetical protein OGAPHI_004616 [Ogataea philodendri]|uniref:Uncharacterized protein n=1 Tax=Ogataea philodendri TaxID=1378263 RepID=A0A9P8T3J9_9ASCO|nr:uncharacterized protein OGAPHI_004616 [Ogataea philodendri]KAH3664264.1 hypothetical protein OGAPHI_004616 [Ogataea philodendri]
MNSLWSCWVILDGSSSPEIDNVGSERYSRDVAQSPVSILRLSSSRLDAKNISFGLAIWVSKTLASIDLDVIMELNTSLCNFSVCLEVPLLKTVFMSIEVSVLFQLGRRSSDFLEQNGDGKDIDGAVFEFGSNHKNCSNHVSVNQRENVNRVRAIFRHSRGGDLVRC